MALEEDEQQHQQQQKIIMASHCSKPLEAPQSVPTHLPVEIIYDILTRLPVKSLLRFRSVCKLWCSIVSDPHFIKSHLTNFSTANINRRLIFPTAPRLSIKSCPLNDVLQVGSVNNALELDYPLKHPFEAVTIFGSCNGLLLIANKNDVLFIWNPISRISIRLPDCGWERRPRRRSGLYDIGYDESADDYKVVAMSCVVRDQDRYDTIVKIYSLKTGIWKKIVDDFHDCFPFNISAKYLNEAFHWMFGRISRSSDSWMLLSLDLAKDTYAEIFQPVYDEGDKVLKLGIVGEWLCVLCDYVSIRADVWVMKIYGVKDSWTKLVSIPYHLPDPGLDNFSVPLCISNDGKVLLQFGSKLVVYDSKNCSFLEIQNFNQRLEAFTFVESLVSPAGARDNNQA